jgi:GntR family transcriptional repressor for pyruvate dehydrogenase complex
MVEPIQIERRKLFEHVAEHLEGLILSGKLKPGDRLPPERELQSAFGVGRPAIREALITLERAGLVEIGNGAPARVAMPSAAGLLSAVIPTVRHMLSTTEGNRSFQAIRLLVEVGLVRQAAREATSEFLADLKAALDHNFACAGRHDEFIVSDVAFHYCIGAFAGDPAILAIHGAVNDWLIHQREVAGREPGEAANACTAHAAIFDAIAARDPDAAEQAMRQHLHSGWAAYWKHVGDV